MFCVRLQDEFAHAFLRSRVRDGPKQSETAPFTVDGVLARGNVTLRPRHFPFPDGEPDQLQAVELAVGKMQLGIREFAWRVAFVVRRDFDAS